MNHFRDNRLRSATELHKQQSERNDVQNVVQKSGSEPRMISCLENHTPDTATSSSVDHFDLSRSFGSFHRSRSFISPQTQGFFARQRNSFSSLVKLGSIQSCPERGLVKASPPSIPEISRLSSHSVKGIKHASGENEDEMLYIIDIFADVLDIDYSVGVFGVFDGHGGGLCSGSIAQLFPLHLKQSHAWESLTSEALMNPIAIEKVLVKALEDAFVSVDQEFNSMALGCHDSSGSCALVAAVCNGIVVTANTGDSKGIVYMKYGDRKSVRSTARHNISNPDEVARVLEAGGSFHEDRLLGCLLPTRAFGNIDCHNNPDFPSNVLISRPQLQVVKLQPIDQGDVAAIVLASDGLWDFVDTPSVVKLLKSSLKRQTKLVPTINIAESLVNQAIRFGSEDDVSVIVVALN